MNLGELFRLVVSLSIMGSVLALGIGLIKLFFRQKLSANWHYYIWFLLIVRLLIPFSPQSTLSVFNVLPHGMPALSLPQILNEAPSTLPPSKSVTTPPTSMVGNTPTVDQTTNASSPTGGIEVNYTTLGIVWISGVSVILLYLVLVNGLLFLRLKKQPTYDTREIIEILEESKKRLQVHSKVSVIYDNGLKSPALFGWRRPKIIISPQIIDKLSPEDLKYVFLHELSHLKRHDLLVNTLVTITQVIYWFNPLIGYALQQMKCDCEIACDATALATVQPQEHQKYGQTIIDLLQLLSEPHWVPGTIGFVNKFNTRRIIMITSFKKTTLKWSIAALALTLVIGFSSLTTPLSPPTNQQPPSTDTSSTPSTQPPASSTSSNPSSIAPTPQTSDAVKTLLTNMMQLAQKGKVINSNFAVKTTVIEDVEKALGKADSTVYVAAAKGQYATFSSQKLVFGINKGEQIFEARSFDSQLGSISLSDAKAVLGTPAYDTKYNGQEIIGYTASSEFKLEMVFPSPTTSTPDPMMDHYSVLYPQGTVNSMADDPGRQW